MRTRNDIGYEAAVDEQPADEFETAVVDEVAERERNLRPSVEQTTQARIDYADERELNGRRFGQTLVDEELMRAREWEIERTRMRPDRGQRGDREARCRAAAARASVDRRRAFAKRASSVDPWADPERPDARELLARSELAAVNRAAMRLGDRLDGFSTAAIAKRIARRVVDGHDVTSAAIATMDELRTAPGRVVPIARVGECPRGEVDIEATVVERWVPSHPSIQQVGLLADDTGRIKFTAWKKSRVPAVRTGQRIRVRSAARNWYRGRVSVALTGRSRVVFLDG